MVNLPRNRMVKLSEFSNLPLDVLKFEYNVLVENDQVYISLNNGNNESTIWRYHLPTGKLTKDITINGQVFMINRLQ